MSIWAQVKAALTPLNVPMAAGVYLAAAGNLPDLFLVYNLVSSPPEQHANDRETLRSNRVQVSIYNRGGLESLPAVTSAMVAAGFTRGPLRELPYNQATRHFGIALEFVNLEES